jgi:anti-sigma factor (TIGR02949 family)
MGTVAMEHEHGNCKELLDHISDYVDGELEATLCAELEAHLEGCYNCRVMVDTVRKTITLYHSQAPVELPSGVEERLYKVLKIEK